MSVGSVLVWILVVGAAALTLACALGLALMREPYQRLHYLAPVATVAGLALTVAFWIGEKKWQGGAKATLALVLMLATNAAVTHATARAMHVRGVTPGEPDDKDDGEARSA